MKGDRLGEFEEMVLLCLRCNGDLVSAVEIQDTLKEEAGRSASLGSLYNVLDRLERKKLVTSRLGEPRPVRGGRRRRCYSLSRAGSKALEELRSVRERMWRRTESLAPQQGRSK